MLTITRSATAGEYLTLLRAVMFASASDVPGTTRTVRFSITDAASRSASAAASIDIIEFNDPPVVTGPATVTAPYYDPLPLPLTVADGDARGGMITLELSMQFGELRAQQPAGGTVTGNATSSLTLTGTIAALNTALATVTVTPTLQGDINLSVVARDNGNSPGPQASSFKNILLVIPMGAVPTVTGSAATVAYTENAASVALDGTLVVTGQGRLTQVLVQMDFGAIGDAITLTPTGPFVASDLGNNGSRDVFITRPSTAAELQTLLRTARFSSTDDAPPTSATMTYRVTDVWGQIGTFQKTITMSRINDAPILTVPGATLARTYGVPQALAPAAGTMRVVDRDSSIGVIRVTFGSSGPGLLTAPLSASVTISGSGAGGLLILDGPASAIDQMLTTVAYEPLSQGAVTITMTANDMGFTGSGGAQSATSTFSLNVGTPTPPLLVMSAGATGYNEDAAPVAIDPALTVTSQANLTAAQIQLLDAESGDSLSLSAGNGVAAGDITGSGTSVIDIVLPRSLPAASFEALLRRVTFNTAGNRSPSPTRAVRFTVSNSLATSVKQKALAITDTNDVPLNVVPPTRQTLPGLVLPFDGGSSISVIDVEATPTTESVLLTPANATIALTAQGAATVTSVGAARRVAGSLADVNATLATLTLTVTSSAGVTLQVATTDPGGLTDTDSITVHVLPPQCETTVSGGHRYFSCQIDSDWNGARAFCVDRGMDLAVLQDVFEISDSITAFPITNRWIGLADQLGEACFGWVDNSTPPDMAFSSAQTRPGPPCPAAGGFQKWSSGEPNDTGGNEDCVVMMGNTWNDSNCGNAFHLLCEAVRP